MPRPTARTAPRFVLRRLHAPPRPKTFALPEEDILGRVESRVATAPVPPADKAFLLNRLHELRTDLFRLHFPLRAGHQHTVMHTRRIFESRTGSPILLDFERFA